MQGRKAELLQRIESDREVLLDFFRRFIRCPSPNPPGDTREAAASHPQLLARHGVDYRVIAPNETMPNIVATFEAGETRPPSRAERSYRRVPGRRRCRLDARPVGRRTC